MDSVDPEDIRRRLRAARVLADLTVEQLAAKLGPGLGAKTIGAIERGEREVRSMELREIALACELPYEWFRVDFSRLPEIGPKTDNPARTVEQLQLAEIRKRLDNLEAALEESQVDFTRIAIDEGRAATAAALESAGVAGSTPGAQTARDEADASPEVPPAPARETRRTEPGGAG